MNEATDKTDAELIELSKENPEFFGILMDRYHTVLFYYVRRLTQFSNEEINDLLQEIFIKIYYKINEYNELLKFSSWAYRIAHNQIIDQFRKINARPQSNYLEDYEWEKIFSAGIGIEKELSNKNCIENIKKIIENLPLKYKEVLILRFLEEKDYEEIMDILKKPKGSVATLIARGREILLKKIKENNLNCF